MIRKLSETEVTYLEEREAYEKVLKVTKTISLNQHGIQTTGRGIRATKIFTRQTITGISLFKLLPIPSNQKSIEEGLWDITSIASLSRNLLEGYLAIKYFGIENIIEGEAELRFLILQLHRNTEWYNINKLSNPNDSELKNTEEQLQIDKINILNHHYLLELPSHQKKRVKEFCEMYKTKHDFEKESEICKDLRITYRLLSNLVHPLPLSIERIDNECGRGIGSDRDVNFAIICLCTARKYLAASTVGIADFFKRELADRFANDIDSIRQFVN
jgi:hypothetical protein